MYFRHLYARVTPDLRARVASWNNYRDLFGVIISHTTTMQLPSVWLWDMIDEFIYQYQSFALFRGKMAARSAEEVEALRKCDKARRSGFFFWGGEVVFRSVRAQRCSRPTLLAPVRCPACCRRRRCRRRRPLHTTTHTHTPSTPFARAQVWSTLEVLNILQALVDKSGIAAELAGDAGARLFATDGFVAPGKSNVLRMLGYFSLARRRRRPAARPG